MDSGSGSPIRSEPRNLRSGLQGWRGPRAHAAAVGRGLAPRFCSSAGLRLGAHDECAALGAHPRRHGGARRRRRRCTCADACTKRGRPVLLLECHSRLDHGASLAVRTGGWDLGLGRQKPCRGAQHILHLRRPARRVPQQLQWRLDPRARVAPGARSWHLRLGLQGRGDLLPVEAAPRRGQRRWRWEQPLVCACTIGCCGGPGARAVHGARGSQRRWRRLRRWRPRAPARD
mmetsp:Transcript_3118/g.12111  ORF Transcript_3118/g.12111 Transcript_3118/m.12111 type:complete len:231 (+) Transcript_3118:117-809(+)